jgi:hypothetical protein
MRYALGLVSGGVCHGRAGHDRHESWQELLIYVGSASVPGVHYIVHINPLCCLLFYPRPRTLGLFYIVALHIWLALPSSQQCFPPQTRKKAHSRTPNPTSSTMLPAQAAQLPAASSTRTRNTRSSRPRPASTSAPSNGREQQSFS